MRLKPIHGMDYFRVLLFIAYSKSDDTHIYDPQGNILDLIKLANEPFGQVCLNLDKGLYCEKGED